MRIEYDKSGSCIPLVVQILTNKNKMEDIETKLEEVANEEEAVVETVSDTPPLEEGIVGE